MPTDELILLAPTGEQILLAAMCRHSERVRRRFALVRYDEAFARWQALHDPLYQSLVSLHRELTRPYKDVPLEPRQIAQPALQITADYRLVK